MHPQLDLTKKQLDTYFHFSSLSLPRHTSYPAVPFWNKKLSGDQRFDAIQNRKKDRNLGLYIHVPYCQKLCFYCGCTREIRSSNKYDSESLEMLYLGLIKKELENLKGTIKDSPLASIHFGGGTPTYLSPKSFEILKGLLDTHCSITKNTKISCEIDPRVTSKEHLKTLWEFGATRLSLGIQSFDPKVQETINRIQPYSMVENFIAQINNFGFKEINFDLIYGLPEQTLSGFLDTLEKVIKLNPSRIALFRLALIPKILKWQKRFKRNSFSSGEETLEILKSAINRLKTANYEFIGLDHFSKPEDSLAKALNNGTLTRNFQGMTTDGNTDILGLGPSSISNIFPYFFQNEKEVKKWSKSLIEKDPLYKGYQYTKDDLIRYEIISNLYCYGKCDLLKVANKFDFKMEKYFDYELKELSEAEKFGLVRKNGNKISLTEDLGRLLVRPVASIFDGFLPKEAWKNGLIGGASKVG